MKVIAPSRLSFLRMPAVQRRVPFCKSSIYAMVAAGQFPAPHRLGARASAWLEHEIDEWIASRATGAPPIPAAPRPIASKRK